MDSEESLQHTHAAMKVLREKIVHLNKRYHEDSVTDVSDAVYDELKKELIEYERILGIDDPTSPTKTVGSAAGGNGFEVVRHLTPMRSLDNVFDVVGLMDWIGTLPLGTQITKEPKLDGLALDLVYSNGRLIRAITRGDGFEGELVTDNAIGVWGVQTDLGCASVPGILEVRGEVIVTVEDFNKINEMLRNTGGKQYANPRNYAAGSLRLKDSAQIPMRRLKFMAYDYIYGGQMPKLSGGRLDILGNMGFNPTDPSFVYVSSNPEEVKNDLEGLLTDLLEQRKGYPYEIDGMVFKVADEEVRHQLGSRSNSPRWATAYKFPAEEGVSELDTVRYQVGKSGVITPVAVIEPIRLCGVKITNITLHNFAEIERLGLKYFDKVVVSRRGDVIPKIESVLTDLRTGEELRVIYPTRCPSCDALLERVNHSLYCPNNSGCPDQAVGRLVHFVSRDGMNIKDLGEAGVTELVKHGMVSSFSSLFYLGDEDLKLVYPNSELTRKKVLKNIQAAKTQPLRKVIFAVGMPGVGEGTSERLAMNFKSFEEICDASLEQLMDIPDIGEDTAQSIVNACSMNRREYITYDKLFTYVEDAPIDPTIVRDLEGKRVVVTGSNFDGLSRSQMEAQVKARGAKLTSTVSPKLDILYAGTGPGPEKVKAALKLGFVQDGIMFVNPKGIAE
jgi:DNA ligase (NAD+)